jgi:Asp-tRNA(Asn)/Glu-tRNA(Gln) amidotransferase A subunit family amidase
MLLKARETRLLPGKKFKQRLTAYQSGKAAEAAVMSGKDLGLLHGLPSVVKDLNATKGIRTTYGSPLYRDHVPKSDDPVVARMRRHAYVSFGHYSNRYAPEERGEASSRDLLTTICG